MKLVSFAGAALALSGLMAQQLALAAGEDPVFSIKPVLLDTDKGNSATLGLDYAFNKKFKFWTPGRTGEGQSDIPMGAEDIVMKTGELGLFARGTLANSSAKTANKLLDFSAKPVVVIDTLPAYYKLGGFVTYETDQGRENQQMAYGLAGVLAKINVFSQGDGATVEAHYGKVDPNADTERKKLVTTLDAYRRWNVELTYLTPIRAPQVRSIEFNYRHYQEVAPPMAVKVAEMDVNRLGLVRLNLANDLFLQYSVGKLPFDQRNIRVVKLGWSLKLM